MHPTYWMHFDEIATGTQLQLQLLLWKCNSICADAVYPIRHAHKNHFYSTTNGNALPTLRCDLIKQIILSQLFVQYSLFFFTIFISEWLPMQNKNQSVIKTVISCFFQPLYNNNYNNIILITELFDSMRCVG